MLKNKKIMQGVLLAAVIGIGWFFVEVNKEISFAKENTESSSVETNSKPANTELMCKLVVAYDGHENWDFEAQYLAKDGPDFFAGKFSVPGQKEADVIGKADSNGWTITASFTDPGHKNMNKILVGKGTRDRLKNELVIEGNYKTFLGINDLKMNGTFKILAKCKPLERWRNKK